MFTTISLGSARSPVTVVGVTSDGKEKAVDFPVTIVPSAAQWSLDGEAVIDTRDFGLPIIRMFGLLTVDPQVKVRFHLQAKPAAS